MADMEVWEESQADRRSEPPRRSRLRRFTDWKDFAVFVAEISGFATLGGSAMMFLLSSLGFTFSGSGQQFATIRAADIVRDTAIAQLKRQEASVGNQLDAITYLVCMKAKREDRSLILPRECNRVLTSQEEGP